LVATGLNMLMPPEQLNAYGWRLPFLLGGAFGLMSMYLRYLLTETPVFEELRRRRALSAETPLKAVVRDHRGAIRAHPGFTQRTRRPNFNVHYHDR
jgi:MFS family permease